MPDGEKGAPLQGFPEGFQLFQLEGMEGLNTKAQRPAIEDQQFSWAENFIPIGKANARVLYGVGPNLYTAPGVLTIVNQFFYNIGAVAYGIAFLSDGSAQQFQLSNGAVVDVGAAGTFWSSGDTPACVQWADKGILIVSKISANAYWAWDGTLHSPGDATSPDWLNGGDPTPMPMGVAGTTIEIFLTRVWILNGTVRLTSVAANGADFATGNGGVSAENTDSSLRVRYTGLKSANGYLYMFGDSSCAYVTNVQTDNTATTTYQYTVIDPQIGTPWRDSIIPYGRSILFANTNGIYALYGSAATKISDPLDGIWNDSVADFTTIVPSAGVATIFGIKVFCITLRTVDPTITTTTQRDFVAMFDGKRWFIGSQIPAPLFIGPQEVDSHLKTMGCDGGHVYELFSVASTTLPKQILSKLWGGDFGFVARKQALMFYAEVQNINGTSITLNLTLDTDAGSQPGTVSFSQALTFVNNGGGVLQFQNNALADLFFQTSTTISHNKLEGYGLLLGFTLSTTSQDFVLMRAGIGYKNFTALY